MPVTTVYDHFFSQGLSDDGRLLCRFGTVLQLLFSVSSTLIFFEVPALALPLVLMCPMYVLLSLLLFFSRDMHALSYYRKCLQLALTMRYIFAYLSNSRFHFNNPRSSRAQEAINYKYFDPPTLEFLIPERGPAGYDLFFTATHSLQSSLFSCSHHHLFLT